MNQICARIRQVRLDWNLSQVDFAKRLGVTNSHISGIEKGKTNPSDALIKLICKEYHVSEIWLKTGHGNMMQEDENLQTEAAIEVLFDENPFKEAGIDIRNESNRVRLLWAKLDLFQRQILAQKCSNEEELFLYFSICLKLFKDINEAIDSFRSGKSDQLSITFKDGETIPVSLVYKDRIAKDIDDIEEFIQKHKINS